MRGRLEHGTSVAPDSRYGNPEAAVCWFRVRSLPAGRLRRRYLQEWTVTDVLSARLSTADDRTVMLVAESIEAAFYAAGPTTQPTSR